MAPPARRIPPERPQFDSWARGSRRRSSMRWAPPPTPPERSVVYRVDERSPTQALERPQALLPMAKDWPPERRTHDRRRHGTGDLFTAQNVLDGKAITESHVQHRHPEMLALRSTLHRHVDPHWAVRVVLDDLSTTRPSTFRGVATAHAVPAPLRPDGGPEEPGQGAEDPRSHCREESDLRRPDTLSSVGDGPPGSVSAPPSPFVEGVLHRTGAATNLT